MKNALTSIDEIRTANHETGGHFFDSDTIQFFNSNILPEVYINVHREVSYFVTSERYDINSDRRYSVRKIDWHDPRQITTVGTFQEFQTSAAAKIRARALTESR